MDDRSSLGHIPGVLLSFKGHTSSQWAN